MKVLDFIYNETTISFEPTGNDDVMVNATEMAKAYGKRIDNYLRLDGTEEFINALVESLNTKNEFTPNGGDSESKSGDEFTPNGVNSAIKNNNEFTHIRGNSLPITRDNILQTRGQNGTWMHRYLALEFAGWLDTKFKVWVWRTIDTIILGHYKEQRDATIEKLKAEAKAESKRLELLGKYPEFAEFLELEGKITEADKKRIKAIRATTDQLKFDLFGDK